MPYIQKTLPRCVCVNLLLALSFISAVCCFGDNRFETSSFEQYPLSETEASYTVEAEGVVSKVFAKGALLRYEITKANDEEWKVFQSLADRKIETLIDGDASIFSEKISIAQEESKMIENPQNENVPDVQGRRVRDKKEGEKYPLSDGVAEDEDSKNESIRLVTTGRLREAGNKSQVELMVVSLEEDPIFGRVKKIDIKWSDGKTKNLMVDPDEVMTSFLEIAVWVGSIKELPPEGKKIRWCFEGKPLPMIVREESFERDLVYSVYRGETISTEKNKGDAVFKFTFEREKKGFSLPRKVVFSPTSQVVLVFSMQEL